jgi:hypothetical protein
MLCALFHSNFLRFQKTKLILIVSIINLIINDSYIFLTPHAKNWAEGLGLKSFRGSMFYKAHKEFAEKFSHHFKKASIPLKIY